MSTAYQGHNTMNDPFGGFSNAAPPQPPQEQNPYGTNYQQSQPTMSNENPFAVYGNVPQQPQQQTMVPSTQQSNQWSIHQQQLAGYQTQYQQPNQTTMTPQPLQLDRVASSAQSVATSYYLTPKSFAPSPQNTDMMTSGGTNNHFYSPQVAPTPLQQPQQNGYMQQQQDQPLPPSYPPPPVPTNEVIVDDSDDDFFGSFSNNVQKKQVEQPSSFRSNLPPSDFDADNNYDGVSVLSKSTINTDRNSMGTGGSPFDDPRFAPKPAKPHGLENAYTLARNAPPGSSPLPDFNLVKHSGYVLARISFRTILIKKWKQVFWVTYGTNKLLVFRSSHDFEDWVSNPYLSTTQRDFLVKLEIDFVQDMFQRGVRGYQATNQSLKNYSNQMLYQFKLERWMEYGPTIAAAFASANEREIFQLRTIISEMLKRSQSRTSHHQNPNQVYQSHNQINQYRNVSAYNGGDRPSMTQSFRYGDNASTGMLHEQNSVGGRSARSGFLSTGAVERRPSNSFAQNNYRY